MTSSPRTHDPVTLISTFSVDPAKTDALIDLLDRTTDEVIRHMPGFMSASLHVSEDRRQVIDYAVWRSRDAVDYMRAHPDARDHMMAAEHLADATMPVVCNIRVTHDR